MPGKGQAVNPMDDAIRGVKVLSEKTGYDENFLDDRLGSKAITVNFARLLDEFRSAANELRCWKEMRI